MEKLIEKFRNYTKYQNMTDKAIILQEFKNIPQHLLGRLDIYTYEYQKIYSELIDYHNPFVPIFEQGVHSESIMDIVISPSKSIFITLGSDKQLKIWHFNHKKGVFICKQNHKFQRNPLSISLHPFAFQCAIGFKEEMKCFFLLQDGLRQAFHTQLKECRAIQFSEMGHLLAVGNYNQICIYNPYTYDLLFTLNGHSGCVKEIKWNENDSIIQSVCSNGMFFVWDYFSHQPYLTKNQSHSINFNKGYEKIQYTCMEYDYVYDLLVGTTQDKKLKIFGDKGQNLIYENETNPYIFTQVQIMFDVNVILFGTNAGGIRMYLWPFDFSLNIQEYSEIAVHQNSVTNLRPTVDQNFLISGSNDGSIYISKMREFIDGHEIQFNQKYFQQQLIEEEQLKQQEIERLKNKETTTKSYIIVQNQIEKERNLHKGLEKNAKNKKKRRNLENIYYLNKVAMNCFTSEEFLTDQIKELEFRIQNLVHDIEEEKDKLNQGCNSKLDNLKIDMNSKYKFQKDHDESEINQISTLYAKQNDKYQELAELEKEKEKIIQEEEINLQNNQKLYIKQLEAMKLDEKKFEEAKDQQKDLTQKEEIIKNKEQEIQKYREINVHLQNYRKVFDYKVQGLQDQRMPLNDHLNNVEGKNSIENIIKKNQELGSFLNEEEVQKLIKNTHPGENEQEIQALLEKRDNLSKKITQMNKINTQQETDKLQTLNRVQDQNTQLLMECNILRMEKKNLQEKIAQINKSQEEVDQQIQEYEKQLKIYKLFQNNKNQNNIDFEAFAADLDQFLMKNKNNKLTQNSSRKRSVSPSRPFYLTQFQQYKIVNQRSGSAGIDKKIKEKANPVFLTEIMKDIKEKNTRLNQDDQNSMNNSKYIGLPQDEKSKLKLNTNDENLKGKLTVLGSPKSIIQHQLYNSSPRNRLKLTKQKTNQSQISNQDDQVKSKQQ
ncbi:WD40-repeat-containing domain [Pseudocohnilembus persalinus]|uniref:WD40-repeat-containing domain n=1 Tax=Pseudocohnilembus persalinus TaxID=266149 RepID=A0A0V0R4J4_PSEPJ|nr:WD40-repeat-containing domain [Pseudocohnilembus persalinus]|eukprot:KRX09401.1 WD40-repeat-containing domain [Pseudocohnilembus persalinus]